MPICGGGDTARAKNIKHIPQWVHHGERDDIVPIDASKEMVDALAKAGAPEVKFSAYTEDGHDSWTRAYSNIEVFKWMLGHQRKRNGQKEKDGVVIPEENKVQVA